MKMTIHSTEKIVDINGVPARIWEGKSQRGTPVIVFVTRIAVAKDAGEEAHREFTDELQEHTPPTAEVQAWPARMLID